MNDIVDPDNFETLPFEATQVANFLVESVDSTIPNIPPTEFGGAEKCDVDQTVGQQPMPTYEDPLCRNHKCLKVVAVGDKHNFSDDIPEPVESPAIPPSEAAAPEIPIADLSAPSPKSEIQARGLESPTYEEILEGEAF